MDCMWIQKVLNGLHMDMDTDMDVDTDLDMVIRCSKKLQYILAWEYMMP